MCNYPLNECLIHHPNKDEILGIKSSYDKNRDNFNNVEVTTESSLLDYIMCLTINSMNFIRDTVKIENIDNTVRCYITDNPLTIDFIQEFIINQESRRQWMKQGEEDANQLLKDKR